MLLWLALFPIFSCFLKRWKCKTIVPSLLSSLHLSLDFFFAKLARWPSSNELMAISITKSLTIVKIQSWLYSAKDTVRDNQRKVFIFYFWGFTGDVSKLYPVFNLFCEAEILDFETHIWGVLQPVHWKNLSAYPGREESPWVRGGEHQTESTLTQSHCEPPR